MAGYWDTGLVIAAVRGSPQLWDPEHPGYKDKQLKSEAWAGVCRVVAPEYDHMPLVEQTVFEKAVHSRWRGVRDSYMKDCKKQRSRTKLGAIRPRRYLYSEQLSFLDKITGNKSTPEKSSPPKKTLEKKETIKEEDVKETLQNTSTTQTVTGRRTVKRTVVVPGVKRNPSRSTRGQANPQPHTGGAANTSSLSKETEEGEAQDDNLPDLTSSLQILLGPDPAVSRAIGTSFIKNEEEDEVEGIPHNGITSEPTENRTIDEMQEENDDDVKVEVIVKGEPDVIRSTPSPPPPRPRPAKRKKMSLEERMVKFMEESVRQEDEDRDFFMSMLPSVRNLSGEQKMEFRIQVIRALQNIKAGRYGTYA